MSPLLRTLWNCCNEESHWWKMRNTFQRNIWETPALVQKDRELWPFTILWENLNQLKNSLGNSISTSRPVCQILSNPFDISKATARNSPDINIVCQTFSNNRYFINSWPSEVKAMHFVRKNALRCAMLNQANTWKGQRLSLVVKESNGNGGFPTKQERNWSPGIYCTV